MVCVQGSPKALGTKPTNSYQPSTGSTLTLRILNSGLKRKAFTDDDGIKQVTILDSTICHGNLLAKQHV